MCAHLQFYQTSINGRINESSTSVNGELTSACVSARRAESKLSDTTAHRLAQHAARDTNMNTFTSGHSKQCDVLGSCAVDGRMACTAMVQTQLQRSAGTTTKSVTLGAQRGRVRLGPIQHRAQLPAHLLLCQVAMNLIVLISHSQ